MRARVSWVIVAFVIICIAYKTYFGPLIRTKGIEASLKDEEQHYFAGDVPELTGSILAQGKASDLKYERVDLGIGNLIEMSEEGDILYLWYGDQPTKAPFVDEDGRSRTGLSLRPPQLRLHHKDGTNEIFPKDVTAFLTPQGNIFTIHGDFENFRISRNRKDFYDTSKNTGLRYFEPVGDVGCDHFFGDDVVLIDELAWHQIFDSDGHSLGKLNPEDYSVHGPFVSTRMGLACRVLDRHPFKSPAEVQLGIYNRGQLSVFAMPEIGYYFHISGAKDSIFVSRLFPNLRSSIYQFAGGKFVAIPHPQGAVSMSLTSANSNGDILASAKFISRTKLGKQRAPYDDQDILISNGKYYTDRLISHAIGLDIQFVKSRHIVNGEEPLRSLDEYGDIIVQGQTKDYRHLFLLRKKR